MELASTSYALCIRQGLDTVPDAEIQRFPMLEHYPEVHRPLDVTVLVRLPITDEAGDLSTSQLLHFHGPGPQQRFQEWPMLRLDRCAEHASIQDRLRVPLRCYL